MRADPRFQNYHLRVSRCENGAWTPPQPPRFARPLPVLEADPFVSPDGKQLYFVSSRQAAVGSDDLDIYVVHRGAEGDWSEPQRLPELASVRLPQGAGTVGRAWPGAGT
jgi:hypothetical protein